MADLFRDRPIGNGYEPGTGHDTDYLVNHVPTDPLASGVNGWEYNAAADRFRLYNFNGILGWGTTPTVARLDAGFDHTQLEIWTPLLKSVIDNVSDSMRIAFFVPDDPIGTYDDRRYLRAGVHRIGNYGVRAAIEWVKADGSVEVRASGWDIGFPPSTFWRIFTTVVGDVCSVYAADNDAGYNALLLCRARVPPTLMSSGQNRIGLLSSSGNPAAGTVLKEYNVRTLTVKPAIPFPFRPVWPQEEVYRFDTDILVTAAEEEQRRAIINPDLPRRGARYRVMVNRQDYSARLLNLLHGTNPRRYLAPLWWNAVRVESAIAVGGMGFDTAATNGRELDLGRYALLYTSPEKWELVAVQTINPTSIVFWWPTLDAFPAFGTYLVPLRPGVLPPTIDVDRTSAYIGEVDLDFLLDAMPSETPPWP